MLRMIHGSIVYDIFFDILRTDEDKWDRKKAPKPVTFMEVWLFNSMCCVVLYYIALCH
jgi:hypothetical protein